MLGSSTENLGVHELKDLGVTPGYYGYKSTKFLDFRSSTTGLLTTGEAELTVMGSPGVSTRMTGPINTAALAAAATCATLSNCPSMVQIAASVDRCYKWAVASPSFRGT